jgi:hypothetical protein
MHTEETGERKSVGLSVSFEWMCDNGRCVNYRGCCSNKEVLRCAQNDGAAVARKRCGDREVD